MAYRVLILGASYGSLLSTKLAMAGHDSTLLCREATARLLNEEGIDVRIQLRGEDRHRSFRSADLPGKVDAGTPDQADPAGYDLVCLAMQEPQYGHPDVAGLLDRIADAKVPCMSIMNMPPPPYLKRLGSLDPTTLEAAFTAPGVWARIDPALMTLCSPDPQAFRPPDEKPNVLHVGLPTNFRVVRFGNAGHDKMLADLENDIAALQVEGKDVPVKLKAYSSPYVPLSKWSMLATGNYRCITTDGIRSIRDSVQSDEARSREIYAFVDQVVLRLGADAGDLVAFDKYAKAAEGLVKPSSVARAIDAGGTAVERVDRLIQQIAATQGMAHPDLDAMVATIDARIAANRKDADGAKPFDARLSADQVTTPTMQSIASP